MNPATRGHRENMRRLTRLEQAMLTQLRAKDSTNPKGALKRTSKQFVLEYGWFYEPCPLPQGMVLATKGQCYNNALCLALDNPSFVYCEGFSAGKSGLPVHHAWVTDGRGRAIDNTWEMPGTVYAGVPFKTDFVNLIALKYRGAGTLLDDWEHNWPLLRDLGNHPEEWLEPKGPGVLRLG